MHLIITTHVTNPYLLHDSSEHLGQSWWHVLQRGIQHNAVRESVLLEAVQEWLRYALQLRFLHHYDALKVLVDATGFDVGTNSNVGKVAWTRVGVDAVEATVKEVIEALVDAVCLAHDHRMTLGGRVADGSNSVYLKHNRCVHVCVSVT